jgi:hypothetical protein
MSLISYVAGRCRKGPDMPMSLGAMEMHRKQAAQG